jgi:predicted Zn-dependent peptidase
MRPLIVPSLLALSLTACATAPEMRTAPLIPLAAAEAQPAPAPLSQIAAAVDVPYEEFKLANGLTVLVHTDRKAPVVGVTTYYRVGAKHEPRGRTGFAHLFEHLFFSGSENVPNFDIPLEGAGSTSTNGSTSSDRTNYVETVPTGALDLALFMESDRMGHLLGTLGQDKLDKQRGVVQNEKRQGDNQPYALARYAIPEGLFPVGHPYRHSTIGSMADLDAASLSDVRKWYAEHYAPNNAILALAGDIDAATARPLVEKWFGKIAAGPVVTNKPAGPVTLAAPVSREMKDQVPVIKLLRAWSAPGLNDADAVPLDLGLRVLGGLGSSRLDKALVRGSEQAVSVSAALYSEEQISTAEISMDVKPGTDRAGAEAAFDKLIADYVAQGPTADELQRAAMQATSQQVGALEDVGGFGGKGSTLAEGLLYSGDPAFYKKQLAQIAATTPAQVTAALQKWLSRPVYKLAVVPGARTESGATMGGWGDEAITPAPKPDAKKPAPKLTSGDKREFPAVAPVGALTFPAVERTTLSNGIPVALARRTGVPKVLVSLNLDAGTAADTLDTPGTQSMMLDLLDQGAAGKDADAIAEAEESLGARIDANPGLDSSAVTLDALAPNLAPSLALMADIALRPTFADADVSRVRNQHLTAIAQAEANPGRIAARTFAPLLFGEKHPYGQTGDGLGTRATVSALTPAQLGAAHKRWFDPRLARITVVGDVTMDQLKPMLEKAFGGWTPGSGPIPAKALTGALPPATPRIVMVDRPNSPQSVIVAGRVLPLTGRDAGKESIDLANEVLGNGFLSRLNMDLREDKGWTYGVRSSVPSPLGPRSFTVSTAVQSDRTGDSIKLLLADMTAFPGKKPVDTVELGRVTDGNIRGLPNRFDSNADVLGAIIVNDRLGRPDDYYTRLPATYRAIDAAAIDAAARQYLQPENLLIVVVGDRKVVEPQLKGIGLPVEYRSAASN